MQQQNLDYNRKVVLITSTCTSSASAQAFGGWVFFFICSKILLRSCDRIGIHTSNNASRLQKGKTHETEGGRKRIGGTLPEGSS